jgi:hypothetical protein
MANYRQPAPEGKDPVLWEIAQRRASFKTHALTYVIVNAMLWGLWLFGQQGDDPNSNFPWPLWPTFGWGIGLAFHFAGAYIFPRANSIEKEYDKLKNNR